MIIINIIMIRIVTGTMTVMIKDKALIIGITLRLGITTIDNHIAMIVILRKENIISNEDSISVLINQKVHGSSNTTTTKEVVKMSKIRLHHNMSKENVAVQQCRIANYAGRMGIKSVSNKR